MPRGFASMSIERRREVQSKGGRNAQLTGKCPRWTPEQAALAGKKARALARERNKAHAEEVASSDEEKHET